MLGHIRDVLGYLDLPHSLTVPIWREGRIVREIAAARRLQPPERAANPLTILTVPGFLDDGGSVEPLAKRLEAAGHTVHRADFGRNIDCTERMAERLAARLEEVVRETDDHVVLVGHSRGGMLSKVVATRHPEQVRAVITVGSPLADPHDITIVLRLVKLGLRRLSKLGVPGLLDDCLFGACCVDFYRDLAAPMPGGVDFVSIASPSDGMVAMSAPRHPDARFVSVDATHVGLMIAPNGIAAIEDVLADLAVQPAKRSVNRVAP